MTFEYFYKSPTGKTVSYVIHEQAHAIAGLEHMINKIEENNTEIDIAKAKEYIQKLRDSTDYLWIKLKEIHDQNS
jgi:hypothetical protein